MLVSVTRNVCVLVGVYTSQDVLQQCCAYRKALSALESYFKFATFRPGQLDVILPVLHGKDVLVCIPTGGGKSLCIFLGVLSHESDKFGVIISPLIDEQVCFIA